MPCAHVTLYLLALMTCAERSLSSPSESSEVSPTCAVFWGRHRWTNVLFLSDALAQRAGDQQSGDGYLETASRKTPLANRICEPLPGHQPDKFLSTALFSRLLYSLECSILSNALSTPALHWGSMTFYDEYALIRQCCSSKSVFRNPSFENGQPTELNCSCATSECYRVVHEGSSNTTKRTTDARPSVNP